MRTFDEVDVKFTEAPLIGYPSIFTFAVSLSLTPVNIVAFCTFNEMVHLGGGTNGETCAENIPV